MANYIGCPVYKELKTGSINLQTGGQNIILAVPYCPPHFTITEAQFLGYFNTLGEHFIAAGDYNAKHMQQGSRLLTPKARQLYNAIIKVGNRLECVSPASTTYWQTDTRKRADLIDFAVTKNIARNLISASSLSDLLSDHSIVLLNLHKQTEIKDNPSKTTSNRTNWVKFKKFVSSHIELNPRLNKVEDINRTTNTLEFVLISAARI